MTELVKSFAVSGAGGFLGFHTRALLRSLGHECRAVRLGDGFDPISSTDRVDGADRLIHIAGINRGNDAEVYDGNIKFAAQLTQVIEKCQSPPPVVVYANSIQAGNNSAYGTAKAEASAMLARAAESVGSLFLECHFPNLFGEHGRPFYNSVTATFSHMLAQGQSPQVQEDRPLVLLHAQNAAEILVGCRSSSSLEDSTTIRTVKELLEQLSNIASDYAGGSIPPLLSDFDRDLFNTFRSHLLPAQRVFQLKRHADARGSFFEVVRSQESAGQTSFSTTVPNVTRGQHFHRRKVERFCVISGTGRISMRRLFSPDVLTFDVDGSNPVAIDMPTMWAHNVSNTGSAVLHTAFWTNDIFDPDDPDTFQEDV